MKKAVRDVGHWMDKFKVPYSDRPKRDLSSKDRTLCESLIKEESNETIRAIQANDITEIADGLMDTIWVCLYTAHKYGLWFLVDQLWDEVNKSNLSKLDDNGNPIIRRDGKIMKSENFIPPNIKDIVDLKGSDFYQMQEQMYAHDIRRKQDYSLVTRWEYKAMSGEEKLKCVILKR